MNYNDFFTDALTRLHSERRYRVFADLERLAGRFPHAVWHSPQGPREVAIWCSNDYLGMGQHPKVIGAMVDTAARMGTGAGGTRNIAGTNHPLVELERELADLHQQGSGAGLHLGLGLQRDRHLDARQADAELPDPVGRAQPQFDDRGRAPVAAARNRFSATTTSPISKSCSRRADPARPKLIVFESLYSMDGDIAPIAGDLRARRALRRHDLYRRSPCGRHVWPARRRRCRARGRDGPHRRDRGHARQGLRLPRRLYRRHAAH